MSDVNGDGLDDFYIGGALGQAGKLFIQHPKGIFTDQKASAFLIDKDHEDMGSVFIDIDGDGDQDLYVVSGGNELPGSKKQYIDRIYINDGSGNFIRDKKSVPFSNISGQVVLKNDIDGDGDQDLFVGGRIIPGKYPYPSDSKLLLNVNGSFQDVTSQLAPEFDKLGMITGACFSDYDSDGDDDLIIVGEWTGIMIFNNVNGSFKKVEIPTLNNTTGLWFSIKEHDYDHDGDPDYFVGNLGNNAKFKVDGENAFHIFSKDFDGTGSYDIVLSNYYDGKLVPSRGRECSSEQMPFIKDKFDNYQKFAEASISDIFGSGLEDALHYEADLLSSVLLKNKGSGIFEIIILPIEAQFSPIMDFAFVNIDDDPAEEIIIVGNHYGAEVETVRYDSSFGCVLKVKGDELTVLPSRKTGFYTSGDSKDIEVLVVSGKEYILVTNNDGELDVFALRENRR